MGKAAAVLDVLPAIYGTRDGRKLLAEAVDALAAPLEAGDSELFRIQRAHRLPVAPNARDVIALAAALDLEPFHFEDLLADPADYELRLAAMRARVRRVARVHLEGLGTAWAVVEAAAIFLDAEVVADAPDTPPLVALDGDGLSHRATLSFGRVPGAPRETLVLHENPFRRIKNELAPRWPGDGWDVESTDPDVGPVRIAIRGVGERTVLPTVFCPALPGGIVFNGVVPDGELLVIDEETGATLGGRDVTPWLVVYRGAMFDHADAGTAPAAIADEQPLAPYTGERDDEPDPWARPRDRLPRPPLGRAGWHFSVGLGVYDGDDYDVAVLDPPVAPVGRFDEDPPLDACVYDVEASGVVGMAWDERVGCAFKLVLPNHVPRAGGDGTPGHELAGRIAAVMPRFRAAGVTAFVDAAADGWELGRGVLRPLAAASGEGVDFHSVRLVARAGERLVHLDPAGA